MITQETPDTKRNNQFLNLLLDWVFPPVCAGCDRISFLICPDCEKILFEIIEESVCYKNNELRYYASLKVEEEMRLLDELDFLGIHRNELAKCVRALKYHHNLEIGKVLGQYLGDAFLDKKWEIDLVVPVPLGEKRILSRGYNQAEIIAEGFCEKTGLQIDKVSLRRKKETRTQVGLNIKQREKNMLDAFVADGSLIKDKSILLIDDVLTTGATLRSSALALRKGGAKAVLAMTISSGTVSDS